VDPIPMNTGMFGGYPMVHNQCAYVHEPNLQKLIEERRPLIHERGDPRNPDIKTRLGGKVGGPYGSTPRVYDDVLKHGDVMQTYVQSSAGGYGDPIERDPKLAKKDLDNGVLSLEMCRKVYCIEASFNPQADEWVIDEQKTRELRRQERERRLKKMSVAEWWQKSQKNLVQGDLPPVLKRMYNNSLKVEELPQTFDPIWNTASGGNFRCTPKGQRWPGEFRAFWNLPEDFVFQEE